MEASAVGSTSMAQQQLRQSGQTTATESAKAAREQAAKPQQAPNTEPLRPVTNMQGHQTGTVVNTTA